MSYILASFLFSHFYSWYFPIIPLQPPLPHPTQAFPPLLCLCCLLSNGRAVFPSFLTQCSSLPRFSSSTHLPISLCTSNSSSCHRPLSQRFLAVSISLASFCTEVHSNYSALKRDRSRGWGERRRRMKEQSKGECSAVRRGKWRQVAGWIAAD